MRENVHACAGYKYYPAAFAPGIYELASKLVSDRRFYRTFVSYFLKTMLDPTQLVHARSAIVTEVQNLAPQAAVIKTVWCCLSLATEKYFNEKAQDYAWSDEEKEDAQNDWFGLIAPGFIPGDYNRSLDISVLKAWKNRLVTLLSRDMGPMAACDMCTSKCLYSYDVKALDDNWWLPFDKARQREDAPRLAAHLALNLCANLGGMYDVDVAFCMTARTVQHQDSFEDAQHDFMERVRFEIEKAIDQYTESSGQRERERTRQDEEDMEARAEDEEAFDSEYDADYNEQGVDKHAKTMPAPEREASGSETSGRDAPGKDAPGRGAPATDGSLTREQIFEVIVRIGLTGAKWRLLCEETMLANKISAEEIEREIERRQNSVNCEP